MSDLASEMPTAEPDFDVDAFVDALARQQESAGGELTAEAPQSGDEGVGPRGGLYLATGGVRHRPKIRYNHKAMADLILMSPGISQNRLAQIFGVTPGWVSSIVTSDAFQAYLASRRAELVDPEIVLSLRERAQGVATKSLQVINDKLHAANGVTDQFALRAFEVASKALGMGNAPPAPPPPDSTGHLSALAERLMRLQGLPVQDVSFVERVPETSEVRH